MRDNHVARKPPDKWYAQAFMAAAIRSGDSGTILLAAYLSNAEPCTVCGFIWSHCRCANNSHTDKGDRSDA